MNTLETCPGVSTDSQEDLPWKYSILENITTSILNLNYSPMTTTSTFISGIKYQLGIPK